MSDELPKGWATARLDEIVIAKKGKKPAVLRDNPMEGFVAYLDIHAIEKNEVRQFAEVKSSKLAAKDDLFVVWDGARSGWIGGGITGAIGSTIMALTAQQLEPHYLRHFIASQFQTINNNTRGTGIPHVDPEVFWNLEVPLAPLAEQRRIVVKLETLLGKVDASQQRLAKIPVLLKRFRQSVLAAACSGRLTADWREETETSETDWKRFRLTDLLAEPLSNGRSVPDSASGFPVLRLTCLKNGRIDLAERKIGAWTADSAKKFLVFKGDFFVSRGNGSLSHVGRGGLVEETPDGVAFPDTLIRVRLRKETIEPSFLRQVWSAKPIREQIESAAHTTAGIWKISQKDLEEFVLPVPPLPEQQEIVRRVEGLFALADQIELRLAKARGQVDKLTPSLLARAFAGKLVPQDPNDEPASALLERIKTLHESQSRRDDRK